MFLNYQHEISKEYIYTNSYINNLKQLHNRKKLRI